MREKETETSEGERERETREQAHRSEGERKRNKRGRKRGEKKPIQNSPKKGFSLSFSFPCFVILVNFLFIFQFYFSVF